jgi:hypothetical protein
MPVSNPYQLPFVVGIASRIAPSRVLDVGVGLGLVGAALRQYLEVCAGRLERREWKCRIEGIEIHAPYRTALWDYGYDEVHLGDAREILPRLGEFDLVLACDVIEHFPKADGVAFLGACLARSRFVVVTSPIGRYEQGTVFGNPHETHRSEWGYGDFQARPCHYMEVGGTFLVVVAREKPALRELNLETLPRFRRSASQVVRQLVGAAGLGPVARRARRAITGRKKD